MKNRAMRLLNAARWNRRQKRGVPDNLPEVADQYARRKACVEAGMPAHLDQEQMESWISGDKLRGPGVTTPMLDSQRKRLARWAAVLSCHDPSVLQASELPQEWR